MTPYESVVLPKWVHRIPSCPDPGDARQWMEASRKLNCQNKLLSDDPNQQGHQYHCLPSSFLNETVEFCGRSVPIGPGTFHVCLWKAPPHIIIIIITTTTTNTTTTTTIFIIIISLSLSRARVRARTRSFCVLA